MCISDVVSRASPGIRCIIGIILSKVARLANIMHL